MKKFAWSMGLAALGGTAMLASACTVTVQSGPFDDGGVPALDDGSADALETSMAAVDTGPTADGADGGSCPVLGEISFNSAMSPMCDMCVGASCCNEVTGCFTGAENDCESEFTCFSACLVGNADAGVPPGTNMTCKSDCGGVSGGLPTYKALVDCIVNNCSATCL
jgi:hypothetical protein